LAESTLYAPTKAVVRSRNLEPGDMASPQSPVFTLGIMDPKWVRTYVPEDKLGLIKPGMRGYATADSWPDKRFEGWVGFISSTAEFTPRSVETPELRTSLVYEVRLNVHDPENVLRLGMPVTVRFDSEAAPAAQTADGN
jgi:HlyD family secretion protein